MSDTILVVDYDADKKALIEYGRTSLDLIYVHTRPTRALETVYELYAEGDCFDAAIIDLELPIMSGIELTEKIRQAEIIRRAERVLPIFWFTAYGFDPDNPKDPVTEKMLELQIAKVFSKPDGIVPVLLEVKAYIAERNLRC